MAKTMTLYTAWLPTSDVDKIVMPRTAIEHRNDIQPPLDPQTLDLAFHAARCALLRALLAK